MSALAYLELTDKLACQGSRSVYGVLRRDSLLSASDIQAVDDQESLTVTLTKVDETGSVRDFASLLRAGRILTAVYDDDTFDEWRVGTVTKGRGQQGVISVTAVSLWLDLVERADATGVGWVSEVVRGTRTFEYALSQRTASQILTTYVLPNLPSWITLGTIDPTYVIKTLTVSRLTPGALVLAVRDALRAVDVACDVRLRRNGTTDYKLDLVTQLGASAAVPVFHPANSLVSLTEKADPTLQATRVLVRGGSTPDGEPGQWGMARWKGSAPSGTVIVLTDRNGGASPIAFTNQFAGQYLLRVKTGRTFLITASDATAGSVTLASVSDIAADEDFELRQTEPLSNTRSTSTRYAVSAVPDATHITCGVSAPIATNGQYTDWYARVWSAAVAGVLITTTRISGSVAATDVIAVASSAGVNATHYVEFVQLDGAGEIPCVVDHPTYVQADPIGYGVKVAELSRSALGVTQLVPNGWMRTWSNGANPPDGWSIGFAPNALGMRQNTSAGFTRYGGFSWRGTSLVSGTVYGIQKFVSPTFYHATTDGLTALSVRAQFFADVFLGQTTALLEVFALKGDGTLGTLLGAVKVGSLDYTGGDATLIDEDGWVELKVQGITLSPTGDPATATTAPFGMQARLTVSITGGLDAFDVYLDTIEAYAFTDCPNDAYEVGDATALLQSGNNRLRDVATPPLFYTFGVRDLARAFPADYDRLQITLGGDVRAADIEDGIDATVRALRIDRDLLSSLNTTLTLANRPTRITTVIADASKQQSRVVSAVEQGQTSVAVPYVPLTATTTLGMNAELATASTGAPTVILSADSAVTYHPDDPTTDPSTSVTVGTPPSRLRAIPLLA